MQASVTKVLWMSPPVQAKRTYVARAVGVERNGGWYYWRRIRSPQLSYATLLRKSQRAGFSGA